MAKNLIQLLTRQKQGVAPVADTPLVLAPPEEEKAAETLLIDDGQDMPASPLQVLANAIQKAFSQDSHHLDEIFVSSSKA